MKLIIFLDNKDDRHKKLEKFFLKLKYLDELEYLSRFSYIPSKTLRQYIGSSLKMPKSEIKDTLIALHKSGCIELRNKGVRINYEIIFD